MKLLIRIGLILSILIHHKSIGQNITQYSKSDLFEVKPVITNTLSNDESENTNYQNQNLIEEGIGMIEKNQFDDAIFYFNKLITKYPDYSQAYYFKALALFNKGLIPESKEALEAAIKHNPLFFQAKYLQAIILLNSNEVDEAEEIMTELTQVPSVAALGYYGLGLVNINQTYPSTTKIIKLFNKSIESDSTFLEPYIPLARAYYNRSNKTEAYKLINQALRISPEWEEALIIRAAISIEVEESINQFEKDLDRLVELSPDNYNYLSWRGYLMMELGRYEDAIWDIRKSMSIKDTTYSKTYKFSTVLNTDNNLLRVLNHYRENVHELGLDSRQHLSRGLCEIIRNNTEEANKHINSARSITQNVIIDYLDAIIFEKKRQRNKAIESYSNILIKDSTSTYTYLLRANLYEKQKKYELAILDYTAYIKKNRRDGRGYEERGNTYFQKGLFRGAYYDLSFAISINGNRSDLIYKRAICAHNLQQYESSNYDLDIIIKRKSYGHRGAFNYKYLNYLSMGDSLNALINLDSSANYNKYDKSLQLDQFRLATNLENDELALRALDRLVKYSSSSAKLNFLKRGIWLYEHKNYKEAILDLKQYIKRHPKNGQALFYLSQCYKKIGEVDESNKWLKKAKRQGYQPDE